MREFGPPPALFDWMHCARSHRQERNRWEAVAVQANLGICYKQRTLGLRRPVRVHIVAPGHRLLESAGGSRNLLATAHALTRHCEVTLVFAELPDEARALAHKLGLGIEGILPAQRSRAKPADDNHARGLDPRRHLRLIRGIQQNISRWTEQSDIVIEKGWRLSGAVAASVHCRGRATLLLENDARHWSAGPGPRPRQRVRHVVHQLSQALASHNCRQLPSIVAETPELRQQLLTARRLRPSQVSVIELGVDHQRFYPRNRQNARAKLNIDRDCWLLTYVGSLDHYHDLAPLIRAVQCCQQVHGRPLRLQIVGDGLDRPRLTELSKPAYVDFVGPIPHAQVADYISAANLCVAPYRSAAFGPSGVGFSTLKIREYMASARACAGTNSGSLTRLIDDGKTGFLCDDASESWASLLRRLPAEAELDRMGRTAADKVRRHSWQATADAYLKLASAQMESPSPDPRRTLAGRLEHDPQVRR